MLRLPIFPSGRLRPSITFGSATGPAPGFFYIPGTDTCLQISGLVRVEAAFINQSRIYSPTASVGTKATAVAAGVIVPGRLQDETGFFARGRVNFDTRTQTAYGTLRAYVRLQIDRLQGVYTGGGASGGVNSFANNAGNSPSLDKGYIQFAGITAGRVQSFFDFYADNYNYEGIANSDTSNNVLAYTYTGAGGISATLALEDRTQRNDGIGNVTGFAGNGQNFAIASAAGEAGETIPDIVGSLRVDQAWGAAQLSAVYHQIQTASGIQSGTVGGITSKDADGFAVQGGVQIKLPMLAAGDDLWIEGAYQNGAYLYQDSSGYANAGFQSRYLGGFQHIDHDAIALGVPGSAVGNYSLSLSEGFSVMAAINHYFTPNFHDVLYGSYEESSYGRAGLVDWTNGGLGKMSEYRVGNQFLWDPVKNLEFGLEFDYAHIDQTLAHDPGKAATPLPIGISKNPDGFEARLRVERDF